MDPFQIFSGTPYSLPKANLSSTPLLNLITTEPQLGMFQLNVVIIDQLFGDSDMKANELHKVVVMILVHG